MNPVQPHFLKAGIFLQAGNCLFEPKLWNCQCKR